MESSDIFVNLIFALAAALLGALIMAKLGQSILLGYILAGIAIGPFTPGFVGDISTVQSLADVGIIFLMFAIGVQLSFRDLLRSGKLAVFGGNLQVLLTIGVGYVAGIALGWQPLQALFLGAVISNSSSTVLAKVLDGHGELDSEHGRISIAWSSIQDLGTVVLVVVLTLVSTERGLLLGDVLWAMAKAGLFLALLITLGYFVFPRLFEWVSELRSREAFILTVAAVALGTAYASSFFGLSLALGAFLAGVIVGESDLSHQILGEIIPLRDVFAGLFFVSVGMLVNPGFALENLSNVLVILVLIVLVKGLIVVGIAAFARRSARIAMLSGAALAQSAEFSFLLASLGIGLGVLGSAEFSLLLAGAAASIALSPTLYQNAEPLAAWVERRLPLSQLSHHPALAEGLDNGLRGHAIICGYGRVGRVVGAAIEQRRFPFVVIDQDRDQVLRLRKQGTPALLGNAANPVILERVGLERARILVVAIPEALAVRQIVDYARRVNPKMDIVVRSHSEREIPFLRSRRVTEAVLGELEQALEMARHTLHRFGVSTLETQYIVQRLRNREEAGQ